MPIKLFLNPLQLPLMYTQRGLKYEHSSSLIVFWEEHKFHQKQEQLLQFSRPATRGQQRGFVLIWGAFLFFYRTLSYFFFCRSQSVEHCFHWSGPGYPHRHRPVLHHVLLPPQQVKYERHQISNDAYYKWCCHIIKYASAPAKATEILNWAHSPSSSPGSQKGPKCMKTQWPGGTRLNPWRLKRWRGRPASLTLWPSSGDQRVRMTPRSIISTPTHCLSGWRRRKRKREWGQRRRRWRFTSSPNIQRVASSWTPPYFTCNFSGKKRDQHQKVGLTVCFGYI